MKIIVIFAVMVLTAWVLNRPSSHEQRTEDALREWNKAQRKKRTL